MSFTPTDEQAMLRDIAGSFFAERAPVSRLRKARDDGANGRDADLWAEMADMGWPGILVPPEFGGSGLGYRELGAILVESGRTLASAPLVSTALIGASALILGGSDEQKQQWLPRIADGSCVTAFAIDESAHHRPGAIASRAANGSLTGDKRLVADGHIAGLLIVAAADGPYLIEAGAAGVERHERVTIDSRGAADIAFVDAPAEPLAGGPALTATLLDRAAIGLAAEMLGQAEAAFAMTVDYLKTRRQFGQAIGGFQALQHRAAKMFGEIELTRSCILAALGALDGEAKDVPEYASLAKARAADTLHLVSNEAIQMHGGIGMTDEHDAGLFLKRARVAEALYGGAAYHRSRYAALLGF